MDYSNINDALNAPANIKLSVVSLAGVSSYEITPGMTVGQFKSRYGLGDVKVVDAEGTSLTDSVTLDRNMEVFVATPKKNG